MHKDYLNYKERLDFLLNEVITPQMRQENAIYSVMEYGLSTPGKRIRGAMLFAFCDRLGVPREQSEPFAVALEMLHAYSLVHDDMPEMDNDQYRRGQPTCHVKYGSALALLAGDGILNFAMEYLLQHRKSYHAERFLDAMDMLFSASGAKGILAGQVLDKEGEEKKLTLSELERLHACKTGALLLAPATVAMALAGAYQENYVNYCKHLGLAFQIKDDLLDVEGNCETLGKEIGKDAEDHKSTFVSILGIEQARRYLENEINAALEAAGGDSLLRWIAEYTASRNQ